MSHFYSLFEWKLCFRKDNREVKWMIWSQEHVLRSIRWNCNLHAKSYRDIQKISCLIREEAVAVPRIGYSQYFCLPFGRLLFHPAGSTLFGWVSLELLVWGSSQPFWMCFLCLQSESYMLHLVNIVICFRVLLNLDNAKDTLEKETVNDELIVGILDIKATSHDVFI